MSDTEGDDDHHFIARIATPYRDYDIRSQGVTIQTNKEVESAEEEEEAKAFTVKISDGSKIQLKKDENGKMILQSRFILDARSDNPVMSLTMGEGIKQIYPDGRVYDIPRTCKKHIHTPTCLLALDDQEKNISTFVVSMKRASSPSSTPSPSEEKRSREVAGPSSRVLHEDALHGDVIVEQETIQIVQEEVEENQALPGCDQKLEFDDISPGNVSSDEEGEVQ